MHPLLDFIDLPPGIIAALKDHPVCVVDSHDVHGLHELHSKVCAAL